MSKSNPMNYLVCVIVKGLTRAQLDILFHMLWCIRTATQKTNNFFNKIFFFFTKTNPPNRYQTGDESQCNRILKVCDEAFGNDTFY